MDATTEASRDIDGSYAWIRLGVSILLSTIGGAGMWAVVVVSSTARRDRKPGYKWNCDRN